MAAPSFEAIRIQSLGGVGPSVTVTITTTSVNFTLPPNLEIVSASTPGSSNSPRYVRLLCEAAVYVNFGNTTTMSCATLNGMLLTPNQDEIICTRGFGYISAITRSGTTYLCVTPIEI